MDAVRDQEGDRISDWRRDPGASKSTGPLGRDGGDFAREAVSLQATGPEEAVAGRTPRFPVRQLRHFAWTSAPCRTFARDRWSLGRGAGDKEDAAAEDDSRASFCWGEDLPTFELDPLDRTLVPVSGQLTRWLNGWDPAEVHGHRQEPKAGEQWVGLLGGGWGTGKGYSGGPGEGPGRSSSASASGSSGGHSLGSFGGFGGRGGGGHGETTRQDGRSLPGPVAPGWHAQARLNPAAPIGSLLSTPFQGSAPAPSLGPGEAHGMPGGIGAFGGTGLTRPMSRVPASPERAAVGKPTLIGQSDPKTQAKGETPKRDPYSLAGPPVLGWPKLAEVLSEMVSPAKPDTKGSKISVEHLKNWWTGGGWNKDADAERVRPVRTVEGWGLDAPDHLRAPERYIDYNKFGEVVRVRDVRGIRDDSATTLAILTGAKITHDVGKAAIAAARGQAGSQYLMPIAKDRTAHIFRHAEGHVLDTPANRKLLSEVAGNKSLSLGTDRFGNTWAAQIRTDGSQVWTQCRDGKIINGGINKTPRSYNPTTGLSNLEPPR